MNHTQRLKDAKALENHERLEYVSLTAGTISKPTPLLSFIKQRCTTDKLFFALFTCTVFVYLFYCEACC